MANTGWGRVQGRPFLTPLSRCAEAFREACDAAMVLTTTKLR